MRKLKLLFICTHNSARSQMAEGLANHYFGEWVEAYSAGTEATFVKPHAIKVMEEIGIDMSTHFSKTVYHFENETFDYIITVCDHAKETCPFFPGGKNYLHQSFPDPSDINGDDEAKTEAFRKSRDEIKKWLFEFIEKIKNNTDDR